MLDALGALAFAIAPWYSAFIRQNAGVGCHRACLLMLHCALSRRVVNGKLQVPQDRLWWLCEMAQAILNYIRSNLAPHNWDRGNALGGVWDVHRTQICKPP